MAPPSKPAFGYYGSVASALQSASVISESSTPEFVDPWWTIISYFNSKKEMAAAHNMLGDQVGTTLDMYASMKRKILGITNSILMNSMEEGNLPNLSKLWRILRFHLGAPKNHWMYFKQQICFKSVLTLTDLV
jgi:hypothetical protein